MPRLGVMGKPRAWRKHQHPCAQAANQTSTCSLDWQVCLNFLFEKRALAQLRHLKTHQGTTRQGEEFACGDQRQVVAKSLPLLESVHGCCGLAVLWPLIQPRPLPHDRCLALHGASSSLPVIGDEEQTHHMQQRCYKGLRTMCYSIQAEAQPRQPERVPRFPMGSHVSFGIVLSVLLMSSYGGHHHRPGRRRQSRPARPARTSVSLPSTTGWA